MSTHLPLKISPEQVHAGVKASTPKHKVDDRLVVHDALILGTFNGKNRLDQPELHKLNKLLLQLVGSGITHVVICMSFEAVRLKKALETFPLSSQIRITINKCPDDLSGLMKAQMYLKSSFLLLVPSHFRAGQALYLENLMDQIEDIDFSVKNIIASVDQPPQETANQVITSEKLGGVFVCSSVFLGSTLRHFFKCPQVHSFHDIANDLLRHSTIAYLYADDNNNNNNNNDSVNNNEEEIQATAKDEQVVMVSPAEQHSSASHGSKQNDDLVLRLDERKQAFREMLISNRKRSVGSIGKKRGASIVPIVQKPTLNAHDDDAIKANESTPLLTTNNLQPTRGFALHWFPPPLTTGTGSQGEGEQLPESDAKKDGSFVTKVSSRVKRLSLGAMRTSKENLEVLQQAFAQPKPVPLAGYIMLCTSLVSVSSQGAVLDMLGHEVPPMLKLFWRMSGASVAFFPFAVHWVLKHFGSVGRFWQSLPAKSVIKFLAGAMAYSILTGTFFFALRETSISHVYLFSNCHSILLVLFRFCFQSGNLLRLEIIGTLVGFIGIFITSHATSTSTSASVSSPTNSRIVESSFSGDMLAFTGAFAGACYLVIVKEIRHQINVWVFLFSLMTFVWVALLPIMFFTIPQLSLTTDATFGLFGWVHFVGIELYLVFVVTFLGTMGRVRCLKYFDPLIVSCTMLLEPIVASWIGIVLGYDTLPGIATLVGGLNVLCGCFLVLIASHLSTATPGVVTTCPPTKKTFNRELSTTQVSAYGSMEL